MYGEVSRWYKLIFVKFSDRFLSIISTGPGYEYVQLDYDLKVSYCCYFCNSLHNMTLPTQLGRYFHVHLMSFNMLVYNGFYLPLVNRKINTSVWLFLNKRVEYIAEYITTQHFVTSNYMVLIQLPVWNSVQLLPFLGRKYYMLQ